MTSVVKKGLLLVKLTLIIGLAVYSLMFVYALVQALFAAGSDTLMMYLHSVFSMRMNLAVTIVLYTTSISASALSALLVTGIAGLCVRHRRSWLMGLGIGVLNDIVLQYALAGVPISGDELAAQFTLIVFSAIGVQWGSTLAARFRAKRLRAKAGALTAP